MSNIAIIIDYHNTALNTNAATRNNNAINMNNTAVICLLKKNAATMTCSFPTQWKYQNKLEATDENYVDYSR